MENGMSSTRMKVIEFMENDEKLSTLKNDDWYMVENAICNFICQAFNINHNDALFSKCDEIILDEHPTDFEEKIYRKVDRYYHRLDVMSCIDDIQSQYIADELLEPVFKSNDIQKLVNEYENRITGEENMQIARDVVLDYIRK